MSTQFSNAPIVELIAEVRWHTVGSKAFEDAQVGDQIAFGADMVPQVEGFFSRFAEACAGLGYRNSERLLPAGVPLPPAEAVYRFRSPEIPGILVQVGWGLVTINALPPYKSWLDFTPRVREIIAVLLNVRDEIDRSTPFYGVSVRYIDAFGPEYVGERTGGEFLRDELGFEIGLPKSMEAFRDSGEAPQFAVQIGFPTEKGMRARVSAGEGISSGRQAVILDTMIAATEPVNPTEDDVFATLDAAHKIIHDMFMGSTQGLRGIMQPIKED